jgi:hypothetical protein
LNYEIEKSCLVLGFYLSSGGMYIGSSFLLQKSLNVLEDMLRHFAYLKKTQPDLWEIDVDKYDDLNIGRIINVYDDFKSYMREQLYREKEEDILELITKIFSGVFGFIPAYETNFCDTFRTLAKNESCEFGSLNLESLHTIAKFYKENQYIIDKLSQQTCTIDFKTGKETRIHYPKAKIIEIYGFTKKLVKEKNMKIYQSTDQQGYPLRNAKGEGVFFYTSDERNMDDACRILVYKRKTAPGWGPERIKIEDI